MVCRRWQQQLLLIPCLLLILSTFSAATPTHPNELYLGNNVHSSSSTTLKDTTANKGLQRRRISSATLDGGWVLHYHVFKPFYPAWITALSLSYFWAQIAIQISSMPDTQFETAGLAMHMALGAEYGLALQVEVFNMAGDTIPRDFMLAVAAKMMEYTIRGFYGIFNARLKRGPGEEMWVTMRVRGLGPLREALGLPI